MISINKALILIFALFHVDTIAMRFAATTQTLFTLQTGKKDYARGSD
jgi:hypothetical protein